MSCKTQLHRVPYALRFIDFMGWITDQIYKANNIGEKTCDETVFAATHYRGEKGVNGEIIGSANTRRSVGL